MKITDSEVIKNGEAELIDSITGDLNWQVIETLLKEKHNLGLQDEVEYKQGDLVIHGGQIAYKLDFDVKVTLSVLFDRQGNCLDLSTSGDLIDAGDHVNNDTAPADDDSTAADMASDASNLPSDPASSGEKPEESPATSDANRNISQMASQIAEMMTQINDE